MATFGNTNAGSSTVAGPTAGDYCYGAKFTTPSNMGSVTSISVSCVDNTASKSFKAVIWDSSRAVVAIGSAVAFPNGKNWATSNISASLSASTDYYIGLVWTSFASQQIVYADNSGGNYYSGANNYTTPTTLPTTSSGTYNLSVYATYTPASPTSTFIPQIIIS